jgi:hypothetical protein
VRWSIIIWNSAGQKICFIHWIITKSSINRNNRVELMSFSWTLHNRSPVLLAEFILSNLIDDSSQFGRNRSAKGYCEMRRPREISSMASHRKYSYSQKFSLVVLHYPSLSFVVMLQKTVIAQFSVSYPPRRHDSDRIGIQRVRESSPLSRKQKGPLLRAVAN